MSLTRDVIKEKIKGIPLFKKLVDRPEALSHVIDVLEPRNIRKGEKIISEGDLGEEMYILLKGEIEISKFTLEKEPYTVARLTDKANVFFGELAALVENDRRSATVTALTDCDLLVLTRKRFLELGAQHSDIGFLLVLEITGIIAARLRKANEDALLLFDALLNELRE